MKFTKILKSLPLIATLIAIDQGTKSYFILLLKTKVGMTVKMTAWFSFVYAWNHGISFGLFSEYFQYSNYVFLSINCLIVGYLASTLSTTNSGGQFIGITFIIGGAIGNLIDRIMRGAVFDFIFFHYEKYSFPAFNLADVFIDIGVGIIVILSLLDYVRSKKQKDS